MGKENTYKASPQLLRLSVNVNPSLSLPHSLVFCPSKPCPDGSGAFINVLSYYSGGISNRTEYSCTRISFCIHCNRSPTKFLNGWGASTATVMNMNFFMRSRGGGRKLL